MGVGGPSSVTVSSPQAQQTASATRSFSPSKVDPDGELVVTITVADYGGIGQLTETFHPDFTFVRSSPEATRSGETLTFNLVGDSSVSYTLTAPTTPTTPGRSRVFSGNLEPAEGEGVGVGGPSSVTVLGPHATRSFSSTRVGPSGQVTVTITARNYGSLGAVVERLPNGFAYVSSALAYVEQHTAYVEKLKMELTFLTFALLDPNTSLMYTVTAPSSLGSYEFVGRLIDDAGMDPADGP